MRLYNIIKTVVFGGVVAMGVNAYGQQDPQYTQYMYNHSIINPAYAGTLEGLNIFGHYRTQWVGLEGAPKTATVSVTTPLGDSGLGLGVNFVNDHLGVMDDNNLTLDLSYSVDLNYQYKLSFGLSGAFNMLDINYSKLNIHNPTDPISQEDIKNEFSANVGAGMFLYSDKAYVGFSIPHFLTRYRYEEGQTSTMRQKTHFYLTGGYVFDMSRYWKFKPAAMIKGVTGAPVQVDVSANFMYADKLTFGAAYRWDAAFSGLLGFQVTDGIMVGYSYDSDTSNLGRYNSGSHEFFLRFTLTKNNKRINAPRFF